MHTRRLVTLNVAKEFAKKEIKEKSENIYLQYSISYNVL